MAVAVSGSRAVLLGGLRNGSMSSGDVLAFDPAGQSVRRTGTLEKAVHDTAADVVAGAVVLVGGGAASESSDVQRFAGGRTTRIAALPQPRSDLVTAAVGGTLYVIGGYTGRADTPDVLATTDGVHFRVVGRLPVTVRYAAVAVTGTTIWVIGGDHGLAPTDAVQRIDTTTGRISLVGHLRHALGHASAWTRADGTVLVAGGRLAGDRLTGAVARFDTRSLALSTLGNLPRPTADMGVGVVGGVAYLFGGETAAGRVASVISVG
jgi:N-acetylneuraminic acid mutarotase